MSKDKRVAIVGAALSDIGRVDDKTPFHLHWQAASRALADAGFGLDGLDEGELGRVHDAILPLRRQADDVPHEEAARSDGT